ITLDSQDESLTGFVQQSLSGAFFVKPSLGEGDLYFNLIPAPFDVQTDLILRCTRVANTKSGWNRIQQFISECIL
ncbi:MAG: hypothetical protein V4551_12780, partial [Pseudomonadota bacterium]